MFVLSMKGIGIMQFSIRYKITQISSAQYHALV